MAKKTSAFEVPEGAVCVVCEIAPATCRLPDKDGVLYVCDGCHETSFVEGIPALESLDGDD